MHITEGELYFVLESLSHRRSLNTSTVSTCYLLLLTDNQAFFSGCVAAYGYVITLRHVYGMLLLELLELVLVLTALFHVIDARDTNLDLMLCSGVSNYFPVVNAFGEGNASEEISEDILILLDIDGSVVLSHFN